MAQSKSEETSSRILQSALALFRQEGFDNATMRDIAKHARVAIGAAYYYYPSKDSIVAHFYQQSCAEMQPEIELAIKKTTGLDRRLRRVLRVQRRPLAPNPPL